LTYCCTYLPLFDDWKSPIPLSFSDWVSIFATGILVPIAALVLGIGLWWVCAGFKGRKSSESQRGCAITSLASLCGRALGDASRSARRASWAAGLHDRVIACCANRAAKPRMMESKMLTWLRMNQKEVLHSIRTAVAAVSSLLIARFLRLPESHWAPITTIVIMQSTLGAAWTVSKQRFAGTALGAAMGRW
jgi:hypothetical protein